MQMRSMPLADGDAGVEQTIRAMRGLIETGKKDPAVHETAAGILRQARVRAFDLNGEVRAVYDWVRRNIRFTRDVYGKETLHAAADILRLRIGDCDDFTILICSLLGTIGFRTRIVTVAAHPDEPDQFSHVYPEACIAGRWIPVDAARRTPRFGLGPKNYFRKRVWDSSSDEFQDVRGLNGPSVYSALPRSAPPRRSGVHGLGWAPNRLPGAYRFDRNPAARTTPQPGLQGGFPIVSKPRYQSMVGLGHYGKRALRGLGQEPDTAFDISAISQLVSVGTTGAANIIKAENAPAVAAANPFASLLATNPALATSPLTAGSIGGIPTTTLLLLGGGAVLVFLLMRGRR